MDDITPTIKPVRCHRRWTVPELAKTLNVHQSTIRKARDHSSTSSKLAKKLEELTFFDRRCFIWPEDFGDPWPFILNGRHG